MKDIAAVVATTRYGLGPHPGERIAVAADPRGWLLQQVTTHPPLPPLLASRRTSQQALDTSYEMRRMNVSEEERARFQRERRDHFIEDMGARCLTRVQTDTPFVERWVAFWSNHFTVSAARPEVLALAGPFEREAIRPHIFGRFEDMLLAVETHAAMLFYLDNVRSIGPNSTLGRRRSNRGLNENLAREILELHTLGVNGGYTQDDVIALAKLLTGWSIDPGLAYFRFTLERHEPGTKVFLGRRYAGQGFDDGRSALGALAAHPSTATHLATKLVRHFVSDDPPAATVQKIALVFRQTQGDLAEVARAIIECEEPWKHPLTKVRSPDDLVTAMARALGYTEDAEALVATMRWLGQVPCMAPSPKGWPDQAAEWLGPEAVLSRIEWAEEIASQAAVRVDARKLAHDLLGDVVPQDLDLALKQSSREEALALLLASPTFQRR
jgi:uncharacterized protein (DUF1800 family)